MHMPSDKPKRELSRIPQVIDFDHETGAMNSLSIVTRRALGIAALWPDTWATVSMVARSSSTDVHAPIAFSIEVHVQRFHRAPDPYGKVFSWRHTWPVRLTFVPDFEQEVEYVLEKGVEHIEKEYNDHAAATEEEGREGGDAETEASAATHQRDDA